MRLTGTSPRNRRPSSSKRRLEPYYRPVLENLEERRLLAVFFSVAGIELAPGTGEYAVTVTRTPNAAEELPALTVNHSIAPESTATPGDDFTGGAGQLLFPEGVTTQTFTVTILPGADVGDTIIFAMGGIRPSPDLDAGDPAPDSLGNAPGANQFPIFTITIAEPAPEVPGTFAFEQPTYSFTEGSGTVTITVLRTAGSAGTVTVPFEVVPGTATTPADYIVNTGSPLTFAPGETSAQISITVAAEVPEDRAFSILLAEPSAGNLGPTAATTITIADAVLPGTFSIAQPTYSAEEGTTVSITVLRTGGTTGEVEVGFIVSGGTAVEGVDYTVVTATPLVFAAGEDMKTIQIAMADDQVQQGDRTLTVTLLAPSAGTLGEISATTVTILDDDVAGTFAFGQAGYRVVENQPTLEITVFRALGADGTVEVPFTIVPGTATSPTDFTVVTASPLVFAPGVTTQTIVISIVDTPEDDGDRTFSIELGAPTNGGQLGTIDTSTVLIADIEGPGAFSFEQPTYEFSEGAGAVTVNVLRTEGLTGAISVPFTVAVGTTLPGDFTVVTPSPLVFAEGVYAQAITIILADNLMQQEDRTFSITLGAPTPEGTLGAADTATITILDDDGPGVIGFEGETAISVTEGGQVILTLRRSLGASGEVSVPYTITGTAAGTDFTITPDSPIVFAQGETVRTIVIGTVQDLLIEDDETIIITLGAPTGGATLDGTTVATITILDDDAPGSLSFEQPSYTVNEGQTLTVTVVRTEGLSGTVAVNYIILASSTATPGVDYTLTAGTLTFAEGVTTQTITIPTLSDALVEGNETVVLQLTSPTGGATLGALVTTVVTIIDQDTTVPNQPPVAQPASVTRAPGQTVTVRPTVSDPDGDPLTLSLASGPRWGTVTLDNAGTPDDPSDDFFVYTPGAGEVKNDFFSYVVSDGRGGTAVSTVNVLVRGAGMVVSPFDQTRMDLVVVGTIEDDTILVARSGAGRTNVTMNGVFYGPFQPTGRVVVLGSLGNDTITARRLNVPMWAYGSTGNDTITGSGQNDVLLGHAGNDVLRGVGGRNLLVGGTGRDVLIGGNNIDVLIGGTLRYETYTVANQARLQDVSVALRTATNVNSFIDQIVTPRGVGPSRTTFSSVTIRDDATRDVMEGRGGADWLIGRNELWRNVEDQDVISEDIG